MDCLRVLLDEKIVDDYYTKLTGMRQWWEMYDNQEAEFINDQSIDRDRTDGIKVLKTVTSKKDCIVEFKYRSVVFDSKIVIIASNDNPDQFALNFGDQNRDAILRRLIDTVPPLFMKKDDSYEKKQLQVMSRILMGLKSKKNVLEIQEIISKIDYQEKHYNRSMVDYYDSL